MNNSIQQSYGQEADAWLDTIYKAFKATTTEEKIKVLEEMMGPKKSNYYAVGGQVTAEMKLGSLEYEFLESRRKITLELA
jgi:hypothetical protein